MSDQQRDERRDGAAYFGREVRFAREHKGLTQQQLADEARYERPYVTRVESGKLLGSGQFADACDRVFETSGFFVRLRERVSERGHPGWFIPYVKLEEEAKEICDYSNALIMGMLQTPAYAEATFRAANPREDDEQIQARVDARRHRRGAMERGKPPLLWVILHESVLRTVVGSRAVMVEQLEHLIAEASTPHITVQVLPFSAGAPASSLPFILLTSGDGTRVLYSETRESGHVNDSAAVVENAQATYDRLRAASTSPEESLSLIRNIAEEHAR
ncbi:MULTISPECIES: helix-turn-helix domain-containing protein [unclassified Streptomyces]|uniref:helix-turn-helix domain-containing protein n=1 Tax=unclassified Streptomyces TaxID=2593676 RepID=UPI002E2E4CF5|nr:helix-turn-helix transcriptional regulator [Streptomyces sp. NBC_00223]